MSSHPTIEHNGLSTETAAERVDDLLPNATAASMLGLLRMKGPMSGWELVAEFETTIGHFWSVTRSQVYRELRVLAEAGYVELGAAGARDRRLATITASGRSAFERYIARAPGDETIRFPLLLTTFFGDAVDPETLRETFVAHRAVHELRLAAYESRVRVAAEYPFSARALQFGISYERMVLAWIDELPWTGGAAPAEAAFDLEYNL